MNTIGRLRQWVKHFANRRRPPRLRADSVAALSAARKFASPTAEMNHLGAEIAILLEGLDVLDPIGQHLPGKLNTHADYLSRLAAPHPEPEPVELKGVHIREVQRSAAGRGFVLPTAAQRPELWTGTLDTESESEDDA